MKLAREWSNPNTLADLGASKALMLLALPEGERDAFLEDHNVIDMSARQLEQAIKERDKARAAAEQAAADQRMAEQARDKMAEDMRLLNASLASAQDAREQAMQDVARLEKELAELKARPVEVAVETVVDQAAIDRARAEAIAEMQEKLDKAKALLQSTEQARKNAVLNADEDMALFKILFQQAQGNANKMRGILLKMRGRTDPTAAQGVEKDLRALAETIRRCAE